MLKGTLSIGQTVKFIDLDTNVPIPEGSQPDYLNSYFCNISQRLGLSNDPNLDLEITKDLDGMYGNIDSDFNLSDDLILAPELEMIAKDIDTSKSSCVKGIGSFICKDIMVYFPDKIAHIFRCSILSGVFPDEWSRGCITVIPKSGKLSDPANWCPITQTSIFVKILGKLVYRRMVSYFDENQILSP